MAVVEVKTISTIPQISSVDVVFDFKLCDEARLVGCACDCIHNLLFSFSNTKIQQIIETTKFILTFLVVGRGRQIIVL